MQTSFPSKLIEGMQTGLPIVVWGPEYCSAVHWAQQGGRALCVTDPNPVILRQALENLSESKDELRRLGAASREAAETVFNADKIRAQFVDTLRQSVLKRKPSTID
jgi:glycosyltransferase involved in cell wall biosynthesis